jgi:hypothetical protein
VDAHALYIGVNVYDVLGAYVGSTGFVIKKAALLNGTLTVTAFRQMATASGAGPYAPRGVHNDDPAATEGYFIGADNASYSLLTMRRITNPGGTPAISGNILISVPATGNDATGGTLGGAPCLDSRHPLDDLDDTLFGAMMHNGRMWTAHNVQVNATGNFSATGGRDGARWYELGNLTGKPTLFQSGTVYSSAAVNPASYFIPTVAVSGQGHAALGCTVSGASEHAEVAVAGRWAGDPAGTMQTPTVVATSATAYNYGFDPNYGTYRWGDYSRMTVDPEDDMTFWTFQEYCSGANAWGVRVVQLRAPLPALPVSCHPAALAPGAGNVTVVVTGTATGGAGFFDPGSSFSNRLAVAFSGTGITINTVTFNNPTNLSLNLSVAASAPTGVRTVTVTNPDGQAITSAAGLLTVLDLTQPPRLSGELLANGAFTVTLTGQPSLTYTLSGSINLPIWVPLTTLTNVSGTVQWTSPPAANQPWRFFQASQP